MSVDLWVCGPFGGPRGAPRRSDPQTAHKSTLIRSAPTAKSESCWVSARFARYDPDGALHFFGMAARVPSAPSLLPSF
ncbi:hypothetical protein Ddc_16163 [Ditylenchus destructor]|nr:hypothetical protein Ddc_16163 [Ditylenchus destructor]